MSEPQAGCFSGLRKLRLRRRKVSAGSAQELGDEQQYIGESKSTLSSELLSAFLEKPPAYSLCNVQGISRPEIMKTIDAEIERLNPKLRKLSLEIHDHPELKFQERFAHDALTSFMAEHGFAVTKHYLGMATAWRAEFSQGKGGRVLGVNSEMDAVPGIGHACGHNLIAVSGVGVALAVKAALETHKVPGKVVLLGTPGEEGGSGKSILLDRGGYKDMDACVMSHPGPGLTHSVELGSSLGMQPIEVEYFGHAAHAAAAPWEGINALDAAFVAYTSVAVLRQQVKPTHRIHGVVEGRNWAANVIPDYAKMTWYVRAPTKAEMDELCSRVKSCLESAALATSCTFKISLGLPMYDVRQNEAISGEFADIVQQCYGMAITPGEVRASTDFGNVTYELPGFHPHYAIPTEPNGGNHTPGFTESARTPEAHEACMRVSKGLAVTGFRILTDDEFFEKVKKDYEDDVKRRQA